jgi:hypothetical protein
MKFGLNWLMIHHILKALQIEQQGQISDSFKTQVLLEVILVKLLANEYASFIMIYVKKDVFGYWTKRWTCGDYQFVNWQAKRYVMPTPKELFDPIGHVKVNITWDLRFEYDKVSIKVVDKQIIGFEGVDEHGKDYLYQW